MGNDNSQIKRKTCEDVLMTFHCHRLSCKMSEQACVHNQQIAREAQRGRPGGYPDHYYDRALSCFDCEQGKEIAGQKPAINQLADTHTDGQPGVDIYPMSEQETTAN